MVFRSSIVLLYQLLLRLPNIERNAVANEFPPYLYVNISQTFRFREVNEQMDMCNSDPLFVLVRFCDGPIWNSYG